MHLKKFYEMNPHLKQHDIYEDTCLHPGVIADGVCDELQKAGGPNLRDILGQALEERAVSEYAGNADFREKLASCRNPDPKEGDPEAAKEWLRAEMTKWAKTAKLPRA